MKHKTKYNIKVYSKEDFAEYFAAVKKTEKNFYDGFDPKVLEGKRIRLKNLHANNLPDRWALDSRHFKFSKQIVTIHETDPYDLFLIKEAVASEGKNLLFLWSWVE